MQIAPVVALAALLPASLFAPDLFAPDLFAPDLFAPDLFAPDLFAPAPGSDLREEPTTLLDEPGAEPLDLQWQLVWELDSTSIALPALGIDRFDTPLVARGAVEFETTEQRSANDDGWTIIRTYGDAHRMLSVEMPSAEDFPGPLLETVHSMVPLDVPVRFDAKDDGFEARFVNEDEVRTPTGAQEAVLEDLTARLDGAGWLALGERVPGDTWEVPAETLAATWFPVGSPAEFWWQSREEQLERLEWADDIGSYAPAEFSAEVLDTVEATYLGLEDVDGTTCAHIALEFDGDVELTLPTVTSLMARLAGDGPIPFEAKPLRAEVALEGEGALLWDVAGGRLVSIEFEAEANADITFGVWVNMGTAVGPSFVEYEAELEGGVQWVVD